MSIPVRYPRTPSGVTCLRDAEAALALDLALLDIWQKRSEPTELIEILQALNACHGPSGSEGLSPGCSVPCRPLRGFLYHRRPGQPDLP